MRAVADYILFSMTFAPSCPNRSGFSYDDTAELQLIIVTVIQML